MPLFHIDAETLERISTHRVLEKVSKWFSPGNLNEGGNYVLTRNDSNYLAGISAIVQDAITSFTPTGTLGTIGGQAGVGFALDGTAITAQLSINLDTAQATLNWTLANGIQQTATFALILYRDAPSTNSMAFYADSASDQAAYSLNIQLL